MRLSFLKTPLFISLSAICLLTACSKGGSSPANTNTANTTTTTTNTTVTDPYLVSTFAGSGITGSADGTGTSASFARPTHVAADGLGNIYVFDAGYNTIRKITPSAVVTTILPTQVLKSTFESMTADATGTSYVCYESGITNHTLSKISASGQITTIVSDPFVVNGVYYSFSNDLDIAVDAAGNTFVCDIDQYVIWKVSPAGVVTIFAGTRKSGTADGTGTAASFGYPTAITIDASGNLYVWDGSGSSVIRKITPAGVVTTIPISNASGIYDVSGIAMDASGNLYVTSRISNKIFKISATGTATLIAGTGANTTPVNGAGLSAIFNYPGDITVDNSGNLYVADSNNGLIRKIVKQ